MKIEEIKATSCNYCQACNESFKSMTTVYFAPLDNNIVCKTCAKHHKKVEPRLYRGE